VYRAYLTVLYTLPLLHFLPSRSATPCAAPPAPREDPYKIIPNLSTDPWTNWGLFWWLTKRAGQALHKEWRSGKVGNVTMVECTGGEARLCTVLLASYKSSQKCPRILGQTAHKSSPKCPRRRAPGQPGCEGLATFVVNTPWIGFLSKDPWTIGTLHPRPLLTPAPLCGPPSYPPATPSHASGRLPLKFSPICPRILGQIGENLRH